MSIYDPDYIKNITKYTKNGIPKIIHQIWINENPKIKDMPENWKKSPIEWKKYHNESDGYIYILWERESSRNFIKKYFPKYLQTYDEFNHVIHRCDLIRFAFLSKYGGFYSDLDNYPIKNIEEELPGNFDAYFPELKVFYDIISPNINLIFCKRDCEIFTKLLEHINKNSKNFYINIVFAVKDLSGVEVIGRLVKDKKYNIKLLPYQKFNPYSLTDDITKFKPDSIIKFTEGKSWYSNDMNFSIFFIKYWIEILIIILLIIGITFGLVYYFKNLNNVVIT